MTRDTVQPAEVRTSRIARTARRVSRSTLAPTRALLAAMVLAAAAAAPAVAADPGLRAQWHMDGFLAGGSQVADSSGQENLLITSPVVTAVSDGRFGGALSFSGGGTLSRPATAALEPDRITLMAWVRATGSPGIAKYLVTKGQDSGCTGSSYALETDYSGGLLFYIWDGSGLVVKSPDAGTAIWDGAWHAVAGTFDGSYVRLYVDGVKVAGEVTTKKQIGYALSGGTSLTLAGTPCSPAQHYGGDLDEVRIYDRALSAEELARLQTATGPDPPELGGTGGTGTTTPPPTPIDGLPAPPPTRNVVRPPITYAGQVGGRAQYRCGPGVWENGPATPQYRYTWWVRTVATTISTGLARAGAVADPLRRQVATGQVLTLAPGDVGRTFFCQVDLVMGANTFTAYSDGKVLTGRFEFVPPPIPRAYGDFRVRGIDVFQTVQPNSGAPNFEAPDVPFPSLCGAGTPTSFRPSVAAGGSTAATLSTCSAGDRDPARTGYVGVPLDQRKPTTAIAYVSMVNGRASDGAQPLNVTLRAWLDGRPLGTPLVRQVAYLPTAQTPWITAAERGDKDGRFGVPFALPASWLASAVLSRGRLDLQADVALPLDAVAAGLTECDLFATSVATVAAPASTCSVSDDRFRLDGLPVYDDLADITVRSLPLTITGQQATDFAPPEKVLSRVIDLFPGGERLTILPYDAALDISAQANAKISDDVCEAFRGDPNAKPPRSDDLRGCRMSQVGAAVFAWRSSAYANARGYNLLLGVHRYQDGNGSEIEPGWAPGGARLIDPLSGPEIFVNDGSLNRPLTAAAHEFGHVLGAPHADRDPTCGGNANGQRGEPWPPDDRGRLQGAAFGQNRGGPRNTIPVVDTDASRLYDLMSYCASETSAWLSPYNWNRAFAVMRAIRKANAATARSAAATASVSGAAFVVGTVGPAGATITDVVPADPANRVPAPDAGSAVRVRARDAGGAQLAEVGATVRAAADAPAGAATFVAPLPARTASIAVAVSGVATDQRSRSAPPSVRLLAPRAGTSVGSGRRDRLDVRWKAADADTRTLQVTIDYAPDGRSWRHVYQGRDTGAARIPGGFLQGASEARVRVSVSDGFSSARAISPPFRAAGRPPTPRIVVPAVGGRPLAAGTPVQLIGAAHDDAGVPIGGRSLTWLAGRRRLGSGVRLTVRLPAGTTSLRLQARDRRGRIGTVAREITILPAPLQLTTLEVPEYVPAAARSMRVRIAASRTAVARLGGRSYRIGTSPTTISIAIPRGEVRGVLRLRLVVRGLGDRRDAVRRTLALPRI